MNKLAFVSSEELSHLVAETTCGAQIFRRTSELIENAGQSGSSANGRNSAVTSRSDTLNSMDRDRLGTNTIRHNAQWAAILLPHPCRLCNLFGAERLSGFIRPIPLISDCREPSSAQAVGLLSRTSGAAQAADRRGPHQPCALVEVLRLAIRFGDRQTRNSDRLASPAFQAVLEDEITPGQAEATQKHPSTDCSNGGRKSNLGAGSRCRRAGSEAGHSGLTANGWNVLAEPAGQQRPYDLDERFQVPGAQYFDTGKTYEQDGYQPRWRAI